jgi:hypothetical protein
MKNIKILSILLLLCLAAYFILHAPTWLMSEKKFGDIEPDEIDLIRISRDSIQTELKKGADGIWYANEKATNSELIENMLYALSHQQADFPIPMEKTQQAVNKLNKQGFEIKVYSKKSKKLDFQICLFDTLCVGLVKNKKQPYALSIPGYNDKTTDYISASTSFYLNNSIFKYLPSEIESVTVENIRNPSESFIVFQTMRGQIMLYSIANKSFINYFDENKIRKYLSYFYDVEYTKMLDISKSERRNIMNLAQSHKLTVKANKSKISLTITPKLLEIPVEQFGKNQLYDTDNFYLLMNENQDIAIAKWIDFDILLKNLSDFVEK